MNYTSIQSVFLVAETVIATTTIIAATEAQFYNATSFSSSSSQAADSTAQEDEYTSDSNLAPQKEQVCYQWFCSASVGYDFSTNSASTLQSTANNVADDESSTTEEATIFNMVGMEMNQETTTQSVTTPAYKNTLHEFEIPTVRCFQSGVINWHNVYFF